MALLDDVQRFRQLQHEATIVAAYDAKLHKWREHKLSRPDARALRDLEISIGIALDKVAALVRSDD